MATDGVKIIDSDLAWDTYNSIMDLYDSDADIHIIKKEVPFVKTDFGIDTDFYYEIFVTTYALAFWEIGEITSEIINEVKRVAEIKAGVKVWTEEINIKEGKKRQKVLDNLIKKITTPNNKIRKRKKYHIVKNLFFNENDVLVFKLENEKYYVTILLNIKQRRGICSYEFGIVLYEDSKIPKIETITNYDIVGRKIPSSHGMDMSKIYSMSFEEIMNAGGSQEVYRKEAERTGSFVIGMDITAVEHKDLIIFKEKFKKLEN